MNKITLTPYGILFGLGVFVTSCIIGTYTWELLALVGASLLLQAIMCDSCSSQYTYASVLTVLPIMLLFLTKGKSNESSCAYLKTILIAMSVGAVIGRIGCFIVGCCCGNETGHESIFSLQYKDSFVNKKLDKDLIHVQPTVLLEILAQSIIALLVWKSDYGIQLYGILNMLLLITTNFWRMETRMGKQSWIGYISLMLFTVLSYLKCGKVVTNLTPQFNWRYLLAGLIIILVTSNDINFSTINFLNKKATA